MPDVVAITSSGDLKCCARISDHGPFRRTTSNIRACWSGVNAFSMICGGATGRKTDAVFVMAKRVLCRESIICRFDRYA